MQLYLAGHEAFGRLTSTRWVRLHHQARSLGTQSLIGTRCQAKKLDRADVMAGTAGARSSLLRSLVWSTTPVDHAGVPGTAARGIQGKSVGRALQKPGWQLLPPLESRSYTRAPYMYEFQSASECWHAFFREDESNVPRVEHPRFTTGKCAGCTQICHQPARLAGLSCLPAREGMRWSRCGHGRETVKLRCGSGGIPKHGLVTPRRKGNLRRTSPRFTL
jgi:hypothetical protein